MVFGDQFRFYGTNAIENIPAEILHLINLNLTLGDLGRLSVVSKYIGECSKYAFSKHKAEHDKFKEIKSMWLKEILAIKHIIGKASFTCYGDLIDGNVVKTSINGMLTSKRNKIPFEYTVRTINGNKKLLIYKNVINISIDKSDNISTDNHEFLEVTSNGAAVDCRKNFILRRHLVVTFRYNESHDQFSKILGYTNCYYSELCTTSRKETFRKLNVYV